MADFKWPARTLTVLDAEDSVLAAAESKSNAQRFSVRGAADQKQLDGMIASHPTATKATIDGSNFEVRNGRSVWIGYAAKNS